MLLSVVDTKVATLCHKIQNRWVNLGGVIDEASQHHLRPCQALVSVTDLGRDETLHGFASIRSHLCRAHVTLVRFVILTPDADRS